MDEVSKSLDSLTENINEYIVEECDETAEEIKLMLAKLSRDQRREVVCKGITLSDKKQTAFFRSCIEGNLGLVEYFITECDADLEEKCPYTVVEDNNSTHEVPPIWVAAITGQLELAKILLKYGADVNGMSDSNSTALRASCYKCNLEMVEYLISEGANVNIPNRYGCSCLMNAVESTEIVKYLVEHGADINARENGKLQLTAVHYAIHNNNMDALKLIVEAGADLTIRDKDGNIPLISAALFSQDNMVNFLREQDGTSMADVMKAYELLACAEFDDGKASGINFLIKALEIQRDEGLPSKDVNIEGFKNLLHKTTVPLSLEDTRSLPCDEQSAHVMAVVIKSRYFPPLHYEFLYSMLQYAASRQKERAYREAFSIFRYAYDRFLEKRKWLHDNAIYAVAMVTVTSMEIVNVDQRTVLPDLCRVFRLLFTQIRQSMSEGKHVKNDEKRKNFDFLLGISLYLIKLLSHSDSELTAPFLDDLPRLIALDPRFSKGNTLLHALVSEYFFNKVEYVKKSKHSPLMDFNTIKLLLTNGANADAKNHDGKTALHKLVNEYREKREFDKDFFKELVLLFLNNDAHIDVRDKWTTNCLLAIRDCRLQLQELNYRSLKCLSTNVIIENEIPYEDILPSVLIPFIELHLPCKSKVRPVVKKFRDMRGRHAPF
ncbi:hypothetical protein FSP39_023766 [Pinctada imbricata]|uniref:Uncharacterized protein n=1 Tax=Pinctada imbricata TaxID=66713 RepID=A0AA88Y156_PINIB|nr:hypothetical protein FSP39_023766 [Pinctada imbricata]